MRHFGVHGYDWANTASPVVESGAAKLTSYNLDFDLLGSYPAGSPNNRWNGFSIRCRAY